MGIPGKVVSKDGDVAKIDYGGVVREANISLVEPNVGEYVIVHAGFAIEILDLEEAQESLKVWNEFIVSSESNKEP